MPKINFDEEQVFDAFIGNLLMEKGLFEEDKNQKGKLRHELREELDETIQQAVINALSDEQLTQLDQLLNGDATDSDIEQFFDNAHIDYEDVVGEAMREFREKYLGESEPAEAQTDELAGESAPAVVEETEAVAETVVTPVAEPVGTSAVESVADAQSANDMTILNEQPTIAAGAPMQGAISEMPGASNVEGVADMTVMTEGEI